MNLTGWKKLACAPRDSNRKQVSRFPVRTLEWSCWGKKHYKWIQLKKKGVVQKHVSIFSSLCLNPWLSSCHLRGKACDGQTPAFDIWLLWTLICLGFGDNMIRGRWNRKKEAINELVAHSKQEGLTRASKQKVVLPHFQTTMTHCSLSWGLALRFPLITEAGSRRECSQIEFAPLLYNVWTI